MQNDGNYLQRRAIEERSAAMQSADLRVRRVHLELAERYDQLVRERSSGLGYANSPEPDAPASDAAGGKS